MVVEDDGALEGRFAGAGSPTCPATPRSDVAPARSLSRAVRAAVLVFSPALSAAVAAFSAPPRAVAMARSAWTIATWPNTPAPLWLALMFNLAATPVRT